MSAIKQGGRSGRRAFLLAASVGIGGVASMRETVPGAISNERRAPDTVRAGASEHALKYYATTRW